MADILEASFMEATGVIRYNMTNNYMFRYILQTNQKVLTGLICALLHLEPKNVQSIEITNPIDLSADVSGKDFILDIKVMLNDNSVINLEMQNANEHNWPERSLMYLCRAFDQLQSGQEYETALPVHHIGFLDYTLFKEVPEFYATYRLMNEKNHHIYSSKFILSVLNLTCIELATEDDKAYKIDYWARLFKAKTWEEIQMVAKENEYLEETAKRLFAANADEIVRQKCLARQDAERRERTLERDNKLLKKALADKDAEIARLQSIINDMKQTNI